ncbi:flavin reductase family protein [Chloroflexota bacterium]
MSEQSLVKATLNLPCSVVILSAAAEGCEGALTATAMYVSQVSPLLVVSVSKASSTYQLIEKSKEFAINVIADNQLELAWKLGHVHGSKPDKFQEFGVATESATKIGAPIISGCFANFECQAKTAFWEVEGDHAIYVVEVVAFKLNENLKPMVWLNKQYFQVGALCRR